MSEDKTNQLKLPFSLLDNGQSFLTATNEKSILERVKQFLPKIAEANTKLASEERNAQNDGIAIENFGTSLQHDSDDDESITTESSAASSSGKTEADEEPESNERIQQPKQFVHFDVHIITSANEEKLEDEKRVLIAETKSENKDKSNEQ